MDSKKYCIWCGRQIKRESKFCPACGKEQKEEENLLIEWLISKTKDKLKGNVEDGLVSAIKNFILSHLYGSIMTLSIFAAASVTIYASEPYIKKVDRAETVNGAVEQYQPENNREENIPEREFDAEAFNTIRAVTSEYIDAGTSREMTDDEFMAEVAHLIAAPSLGINGVFERKSDMIFADSNGTTSIDFDSESFDLEISRRLADNGYRVAESTYGQVISSNSRYTGNRKVVLTMVELNGGWFVAESRVTERNVSEAGVAEYDTEANDEIHSKSSRYLTDINNANRVASVEALKAPESSGLRGVYEIVRDERFRITSASNHRTEFTPALHTLQISKTLTSQGYEVGENVVEEWSITTGTAQTYRKVIFAYAKIDGQWLMVENRILELKADELPVAGEFDQDFMPEFTLDGNSESSRIMNYMEDLYNGSEVSGHYFRLGEYTAGHDMAKLPENGVKEATVEIRTEELGRVDSKYSDLENSITAGGNRMYQVKAVLYFENTTGGRSSHTYTVLFVEEGAQIGILDTILTEDAIIF